MGQNLELELLPIGSVIMFKDWEHPLMVYGRKQMDSETKKNMGLCMLLFSPW